MTVNLQGDDLLTKAAEMDAIGETFAAAVLRCLHARGLAFEDADDRITNEVACRVLSDAVEAGEPERAGRVLELGGSGAFHGRDGWCVAIASMCVDLDVSIAVLRGDDFQHWYVRCQHPTPWARHRLVMFAAGVASTLAEASRERWSAELQAALDEAFKLELARARESGKIGQA